MSDRNILVNQLRERRLAILQFVEQNAQQMVADRLRAILAVKDQCQRNIDRFEAMASSANDLVQKIGQFHRFFDAIDDFSETLSEQASDIKTFSEEVGEITESLCDDSKECLDDQFERVAEVVDRSFGAFDRFADRTVGKVENQAEEMFEQLKSVRDHALGNIVELCVEQLPGGVKQDTEKLLARLESFEECGIEKMEQISKKIRSLTDQVKEITDTIETVKPALEILL